MKFLWYGGYVALGLGFPVFLIAQKYQLFYHGEIPLKLTGMGIITLGIIAFFAKDQLKQTVATLPEGKLKTTLLLTKTPLTLGIITLVVVLAQMQLENIIFILGWATAANMAAIYPRLQYLKHKEIKDDKTSAI